MFIPENTVILWQICRGFALVLARSVLLQPQPEQKHTHTERSTQSTASYTINTFANMPKKYTKSAVTLYSGKLAGRFYKPMWAMQTSLWKTIV
jgi:hypothetical protein